MRKDKCGCTGTKKKKRGGWGGVKESRRKESRKGVKKEQCFKMSSTGTVTVG